MKLAAITDETASEANQRLSELCPSCTPLQLRSAAKWVYASQSLLDDWDFDVQTRGNEATVHITGSGDNESAATFALMKKKGRWTILTMKLTDKN
ncbi:hypothetical protein [Cohnella sp. OV330]|uniref:hypothetical protein n=1 Tax=Cohnella sp. OV330 TaxID=1855288 RepID=UPI0011601AE1|nr:hypothetical protein [Cohnella sp. OV330]